MVGGFILYPVGYHFEFPVIILNNFALFVLGQDSSPAGSGQRARRC